MSLWRALIAESTERVLPWLGGRDICAMDGRAWQISGRCPPEYGFWRFTVDGGRSATFSGWRSPEPMPDDAEWNASKVYGYLVGDRLIRDNVSGVLPSADIMQHSRQVFLVPPGLRRFTRVSVILWPSTKGGEASAIYCAEEFDIGPETAVEQAYQDRALSISCIPLSTRGIPNVTPALDLAFRFMSAERINADARRAEAERQRELERLREEALERTGSSVGRRSLAAVDFNAAARAALSIGGAEFLDARPGYDRAEMVVTFRLRNRRFECVCDRNTLRIISSGICLTGRDGTSGDTRFTLESLPSVYAEAIDTGVLHVYRHVD